MSGGSILGLEVQRKGSRQKSGEEVLGGAAEGGRIGKRGGLVKVFGGIFQNLEKGANLMCWYLGQ